MESIRLDNVKPRISGLGSGVYFKFEMTIDFGLYKKLDRDKLYTELQDIQNQLDKIVTRYNEG